MAGSLDVDANLCNIENIRNKMIQLTINSIYSPSFIQNENAYQYAKAMCL